jgi:serine/threonine protein kinase
MDETTMEFSFVGLSELLKQPVIVKMMLNNPQSRREVKVQQFFKKNPHRNIVQGICEFKCQDNSIKWKVKLKGPKQMCNPEKKYENSEFIIIIQEYIRLGNLDYYSETINYYKWKSLITQMLYGSLELFEKYGFFYDDWKSRNILVDETDEISVTYKCFSRDWIVPNTFGLTPVLTDFSLCRFLEKSPENLAYQLSFCLDTFGRICPNSRINKLSIDLAIKIEQLENLDTILDTLSDFISSL